MSTSAAAEVGGGAEVVAIGGVVVGEDGVPEEQAPANRSAVQVRRTDRLIMLTA
jgi:hypothetical protein